MQSVHSADEKTEAQRDALTRPGSHSRWGNGALSCPVIRAFKFPHLLKNTPGVVWRGRKSVSPLHSLLPSAPMSLESPLNP